MLYGLHFFYAVLAFLFYAVMTLIEIFFKLLIKQWSYLDILSNMVILIFNYKKYIASRKEKQNKNKTKPDLVKSFLYGFDRNFQLSFIFYI